MSFKQGARSNLLLKHELVHVCQYERFGIEGVACRCAYHYVDSGYDYWRMCFEQQASYYARLQEADTPSVADYLGDCN